MLDGWRVADEVADALSGGRPVVALESTLIAHGLPWPDNLETARASESAVRAAGAVPATIAVGGGVVRVGLDDATLERMATSGGFLKAGRRDLSAIAARGLDAATTVSATLWIARRAGLGVMATGGLGGVHRDAADVSADLDELARADGVLVVCSGVKTILDVPATLERLESLGVPVVGYRTATMPGFTTPETGLPLEWRADDPAGAAAIVASHRRLGLPGAVVLVQRVAESIGVPGDLMDRAIAAALAEASSRGITGKPLTPLLLDFVRSATAGKALAANRALIVANAGLAGEVAGVLGGG